MTDHSTESTEELRRRAFHLGLDFQGGKYDLLERLKGYSYPPEPLPKMGRSLFARTFRPLVDAEGNPEGPATRLQMADKLVTTERSLEEALQLVDDTLHDVHYRYGYVVHSDGDSRWVTRRELKGLS